MYMSDLDIVVYIPECRDIELGRDISHPACNDSLGLPWVI